MTHRDILKPYQYLAGLPGGVDVVVATYLNLVELYMKTKPNWTFVTVFVIDDALSSSMTHPKMLHGVMSHDDAPSKFQLLTPTLEWSVSHLPGQPKKCGWWWWWVGVYQFALHLLTAAWYLGTSLYRARTSKRYLRYGGNRDKLPRICTSFYPLNTLSQKAFDSLL